MYQLEGASSGGGDGTALHPSAMSHGGRDSPSPVHLPGKGKKQSEGDGDVLSARPPLLPLSFRELRKLIRAGFSRRLSLGDVSVTAGN